MSDKEFFCYCNECGREMKFFGEMRFVNYKNKKTSVMCALCYEKYLFDHESDVVE